MTLPYDLAASSANDTHSTGGFDAQGNALPSEMLPSTIDFNGVEFHLAIGGANHPDALIPKGQTISLPSGDYNRVYCSRPPTMEIRLPPSASAKSRRRST